VSSLIDATDFDWPIVAGPCGSGGPDGVTQQQWAAAQEAAVTWLWSLSGRRFGTWTVVWRPEWTNRPPARPWRLGGAFGWPTPAACAVATGPMLATDPAVTVLPGPVVDVTEVLVDGAALDSDAWTVQDDELIRTDGQPWPLSQDTTLPATETGTWQVTYTRGRPVPSGGQVAAGQLACEIAAALVPGGDCALPANVTSVVRNGVTISKQIDQLNLGFTGLFAVDQWARTVNPQTLPSEPDVWTPDLDPSTWRSPSTSGRTC
jgi:hypothetical protein